MMSEVYYTISEEETCQLGFDFAKKLKSGDSVALFGELGSGKTELIKGICDYFKVEDLVSSPTFTIFNQYTGQLDDEQIQIYHIDLYRIKNLQELDEIGFKECFYSDGIIKLVEWAEKTNHDYSWNYKIYLTTDVENENGRTIKIETNEQQS